MILHSIIGTVGTKKIDFKSPMYVSDGEIHRSMFGEDEYLRLTNHYIPRGTLY